jgi:RNA polymerase sigma-70 factor (ECF subfamily)
VVNAEGGTPSIAALVAATWPAWSLPFQDAVETELMSHEAQIMAIRETIVASRPQLVRLAYRLLGNWSDAEDVFHNSCVRALESASRLKTQENIRGWLSTITRHLAIDRCRLRGRYVPFEVGQEPWAAEPEASPLWTELGEGDVRNALQQCSPTFRDVYELHELQGLSYEETAQRLSIAVGTVGTRLFRARNKLRTVLSQTLADRKSTAAA